VDYLSKFTEFDSETAWRWMMEDKNKYLFLRIISRILQHKPPVD